MLTFVRDETPVPRCSPRARTTTEWRDQAGRMYAVGMTDGQERRIDWPDVGVFRFDPASPTVRFHPSGSQASEIEDFFDRAIQPLVLQAQGLPVLHASAASGPSGAMVFCGPSGCGKSTVSYAVARRKTHEHLADDAVVLQRASGRWALLRVPFRPRLRASAAQHFGVAAPTRATAASGTTPIRAIVSLGQSPDGPVTPRLTRVGPTRAFPILLSTAHCFDDADRDAVSQMVRSYLSVVETVPVFTLDYRPDFSRIAELLAAVDEAAAAAERP